MKQWGLAVISLGGVLIMSSQLQDNAFHLVVAGLSLVIGGIVMFLKGKSSNKK